jgi:PAS domain-containing protein
LEDVHTLETPRQSDQPGQTGVRRRILTPDAATGAPSSLPQAYRAALDVTSDAVVICNEGGFISYANRAGKTLLGESDVEGRCLSGLAWVGPSEQRTLLRALRKQRAWSGTLHVRIGSSVRALEVSMRAIERSHGQSLLLTFVARAAAANGASLTRDCGMIGALSRVAGEIAHDFNNHIAVVLNYSYILLRELPGTSPLRSHTSELQMAAMRASEIARDIVRFGGQRRVDVDVIDVNAVLSEGRGLFTYALRGMPAIRIEHHLTEDLLHVRARRAHLEWLIVELVSRVRAGLGRMELLRIGTDNQLAGGRHVLLSVEGHPTRPSQRDPADDGSNADESAVSSSWRSIELPLSHVRGELTSHQLGDGGLKYQVRLPAL